MAKKEIEIKKPKPEIKIPTKEKHSFFPKLLILFSLIVIAIPVLDFFNLYVTPKLALNIILLLAGLWMLKLAIKHGFIKKRREIFKKYI